MNQLHQLLIHQAHHETRVGLIQQGVLQELHIERHEQRGIVGNVYWGKVNRILPSMQSAFIDIGVEKAAFLHVADLLAAKVAAKAISTTLTLTLQPIEQQVFVGQSLLVQVLKDPLGTKGARLTTQISLVGRYLVLLPQDTHIGISQKITNIIQKQALRERLTAALPNHFSWGVIARTQAQLATTAQLADDIAYLTQVWHKITQGLQTLAAPTCLHRDLNLAQRALRDFCTEQTQEIVVDGLSCYRQLQAFALAYMPAILPKLVQHTAERGLFELARVDAQIDAALNRRVNLPSGAYLVIDQTEAMCTIDVNTGSFVGSKRVTLTEAILKTNLEAALEIARQLRLRNLGGIILIDFIDMKRQEDRQTVRLALEQALAHDLVYSHIYGFTALGLMELSRKRVRESLAHVLLQSCPCCVQIGQVKTVQSVAYEILRELELQARQFNGTLLTVQAAAPVVAWFAAHQTWVDDLAQVLMRKIEIMPINYNSNCNDNNINNINVNISDNIPCVSCSNEWTVFKILSK